MIGELGHICSGTNMMKHVLEFSWVSAWNKGLFANVSSSYNCEAFLDSDFTITLYTLIERISKVFLSILSCTSLRYTDTSLPPLSASLLSTSSTSSCREHSAINARLLEVGDGEVCRKNTGIPLSKMSYSSFSAILQLYCR